MTTNLTAGWTSEDIQFLIEKVKCWLIVLIEESTLGIPNIQDIPGEAIADWGYDVLNANTGQYSILYDIQQSPSGKGWAHVDVLSGVFPFDKAAVLEQLVHLIETQAVNVTANQATLTPKPVEVLEPQAFPEQERAITCRIPENKGLVVKTLTFREEGKRLIAFNEDWLAICCCSVDRGTGEISHGSWRMYHTSFIGVLDPATDRQVCGPDIRAVMKRTGEIYGVEVKLEEAPDWLMPPKSLVSAMPSPSPIKPGEGLVVLDGLGGEGS